MTGIDSAAPGTAWAPDGLWIHRESGAVQWRAPVSASLELEVQLIPLPSQQRMYLERRAGKLNPPSRAWTRLGLADPPLDAAQGPQLTYGPLPERFSPDESPAPPGHWQIFCAGQFPNTPAEQLRQFGLLSGAPVNAASLTLSGVPVTQDLRWPQQLQQNTTHGRLIALWCLRRAAALLSRAQQRGVPLNRDTVMLIGSQGVLHPDVLKRPAF